MSQEREKKHIRWILTSWKLMVGFSFISMRSGLCLSFPSEPMALRVLGALLNLTGALSTLTSSSPLSGRPVSAQSLAPSPGLNYAGLSLTLPSGWTQSCLQSYLLPLSAGLTLEVPGYLSGQRLLVRFIAVTWALPHPQTPWDCHSASEGMACAGSPVLPGLVHSWHSPAPTACGTCRDSVYALGEIPSEKFSQTI